MFNNRISLNSVLIPKLLSNPFASYSFTNLDFLIPHSAHFDYMINLLFLVLKIFEFGFSDAQLSMFCFIRFNQLKIELQ